MKTRNLAHSSGGVNVVGYLTAEAGLGEAARRIVGAIEKARIPMSTVTYTRMASRQQHPFRERGGGDAVYDTNIICLNARELLLLREDVGPALFDGRYSIGVWFWELSRFPADLHRAFHLVDEIWVASEFARAAIAPETEKPVHVVPIPLEAPPVVRIDRSALGLPDSFVFLFNFDFFSVSERKNPLGLIEAFSLAFRDGEGPVLVIKTINGDRRPEELEPVRRAAAARSDVLVMDGYVSPDEKNAMMATCDCYVSLHRSEGLGLTMAEAMGFGRPVIATGYSGNLAFMNESNSYLVRYRVGSTSPAVPIYPPGVEWAEPDLDHAAALMRHVYEHPEEARERGERARRDLLANHTVERTAAFVRERLAALPKHERLLRDVRTPVERAAVFLAREPGIALQESRGRLGFVRRLLRRALWPELEEQRRVQESLVEALRGLEDVSRTDFDARLAELERRVESTPDDAARAPQRGDG